MRVVIVHYHLQTGGVGRVVQHACRALLARGERVVVLSGAAAQVSLPEGTALTVLPGMEYEERREPQTPDRLAAIMIQAATDALGGTPDLWHLHNHCLGKNTALPGAVLRLARGGHRLLLQPHDFAEDGRPGLYLRMREELAGGDVGRLSALLYPLAPNIHYATLNERDRRFLASAGVPDQQLHLLPNAVSMGMPGSESPAPAPAPQRSGPRERLWLYPTRAIRRKNLGEFLLWAALAEEQDRFAVTQAPQNPQERPIYEQWVALAQELNLPVRFEVGGGDLGFPALIESCHALVTTSVAEGFGLAFLEPWLMGRPLVGRDLPEITADFVAEGVRLPGQYQRLDVPLAWVDEARLRDAFELAVRQRADAYGRASGDAAEHAWANALEDGRIDFGRLDETAQTAVIRRVHADPSAGQALQPRRLDASAADSVIQSNLGVVDRRYSLEGFGQRLLAIYATVAGSTPSATFGAADGETLLEHFLDPRRLTLLRT